MTSLPHWFLLNAIGQDVKPHGAHNISRLPTDLPPFPPPPGRGPARPSAGNFAMPYRRPLGTDIISRLTSHVYPAFLQFPEQGDVFPRDAVEEHDQRAVDDNPRNSRRKRGDR